MSMEKKTTQTILPLFPLPLVLFPQMKLPLHIFEMRYREMIGNCIESRSPFGVIMSRENDVESVGCGAQVIEVLKRFPGGEFDIMTVGSERFRILELFDNKTYLEGMVEFFRDEPKEESGFAALSEVDLLEEVFGLCYRLLKSESKVEKIRTFTQSHSGTPSFLLANHLGFDLNFQQKMLEMVSEEERLSMMIDRLAGILGPESTLVAKGFLEGQSWFNVN
ncbi:MAG: LON peptidase substrate-binding domain-containing protein [Candidatus Omnitrophica bacterium]|nr:LON peptidase substrate-binding domain-containing protein [Candidatus Omnitrophota bacterium]MCA9440976.1 LON peptidase substrate-binding domain-containing protein [Candidatus Omnitrophota bacterium]MCB9767345.1 LON peptidase substrate-binding domain-containing protein [Candidatus Omnitrophota bacterium]